MSTMQAVNFTKIRAEANALALKFIKLGGTLDEWITIFVDAANGMPGEGQQAHASDGRTEFANARQPIPNEGHHGSANNGPKGFANARNPITSGSGHGETANRGHGSVAAPVREPTTSQLKAAGAARLASSRTVLDMRKTIDGVAWGDVLEHELPTRDRDGEIARAVNNYIGPRHGKMRHKPVRDLLTAKQFQNILDMVERKNAA